MQRTFGESNDILGGGGREEKRKPGARTFDGEGPNFDTEITILFFHLDKLRNISQANFKSFKIRGNMQTFRWKILNLEKK